MSFTGGGELDNGHSVSLGHYMTVEGAQSSSILTYDMGDAGKIMFTDGAGGIGIAGIDDLMPTAVEEPWDGLGGTKNGYVSQASSGFEYTNTSVDGVKIEIGYGTSQASNDDGGVSGTGATNSSDSIAVQYTGIEGANLFFGTGTLGGATETDVDTMGATYSMGAATIGVQSSTVDPAATAEEETLAYSVSFAVNDDLSISYGESTTELSGSVDQEIKGISVGYSMGGLSVAMHANEGDNIGNTANNYKHTELSVSFAF
jgi:outer membrane protein OmpU